jgi:hypothetical protein
MKKQMPMGEDRPLVQDELLLMIALSLAIAVIAGVTLSVIL